VTMNFSAFVAWQDRFASSPSLRAERSNPVGSGGWKDWIASLPSVARNDGNRVRVRNIKRRILAVCLATALLIGPVPARADGPALSFIRDAEIESSIRRMGDPIFRAAGLDPAAVQILLVRDPTLNAFVAGGQNIFIHTGLLLASTDASQLIGVIAHETGHIAGGHLIRGRDAMTQASAEAVLAMILGVAAGIASGNVGAGAAVITGGQQVAMRSLLSYSRGQEASADNAGLMFLDRACLSAAGLLGFLETLAGQDLLPLDRQVEFVRTHPLTQDRIDAVRYHVEHAACSGKAVDPAIVALHDRMKAKLQGYLNPDAVLLRTTDGDPRLNTRYSRAIAFYRKQDTAHALSLLDGLLQAEPKNPFFWELKGQILFENGQVAAAVPAYRQAVDLFPDSALLRTSYAQTLVELNRPDQLDEAITQLQEANRLEARSPLTWRLLATSWGKQGKEGDAAYALAEESLAKGDTKTAKGFASRAMKLLKPGAPGWLRAQDISLMPDDEDDNRR
jgi:predicted Zn-dependent protease